MSFEVFVQCFQNGKSASIPCERIREAFGSSLTEPELDSWHLHYDDSNSCDLDLFSHGSDSEAIAGVGVSNR